MNSLLELAIDAHGGMRRWNEIRSIDVTFNFYGGLLTLKGYPGHRTPTVSVDAHRPTATLWNLAPGDDVGMFSAERVWTESPDGSLLEERLNPRDSFREHERGTPWDRLHLLYFVGYAMWNYLAAPFMFAQPDFAVRELGEHAEGGETWRVLEVTFPSNVPTHTPVQRIYFDALGMLKRLDYVADVLGGIATHYCYDPKNFSGIMMPTLRRVVERTPDGPLTSGATSFVLDYTRVCIHD